MIWQLGKSVFRAINCSLVPTVMVLLGGVPRAAGSFTSGVVSIISFCGGVVVLGRDKKYSL